MADTNEALRLLIRATIATHEMQMEMNEYSKKRRDFRRVNQKAELESSASVIAMHLHLLFFNVCLVISPLASLGAALGFLLQVGIVTIVTVRMGRTHRKFMKIMDDTHRSIDAYRDILTGQTEEGDQDEQRDNEDD